VSSIQQASNRHLRAFWAAVAAAVVLTLAPTVLWAQSNPPSIRVVSDDTGTALQVNDQDFMVFGMNWGYMPIGENYLYDFWKQPDDFIEAVLDDEMPLLTNMGVNTIRQYVGIPPRWVQYIYERYGIFTVINHPVARWGYTIDGVWMPTPDYSDPRLREAVTAEIAALADEFRGVPGVLMWLLGNENNYGLSWSSFEIEALPEGERDAARARYLYSLYGEITGAIKQRDPDRPVAIANGDLQYIDIIAEECRNIDVLGSNVYRGISARDFFQVIEDKLGIPAMFTEFGADAWNAKEMREDQATQARYLLGQWQEIYEQSRGKGRVGNAIGGIIFQWSDGWWKFGQDDRLDIHDTNASWPNAGYPEDYVEGDNNMNEEWWGITAKGPRDHNGFYKVYPRAAYYALRHAFTLDPYAPETDLEAIRAHFATITPISAELEARADDADELSRVRVSNLRMEFETYSTGGTNISTPDPDDDEDPQESLPSYLGFDHQQSFYVDFQARPAGNVIGNLSLNILGNVGSNRIDEIFYENRGIQQTVVVPSGTVDLQGLERVKVYQADVSWDDRWFRLDGFYRTGHFHWGYEGDFFGIYREAYYGENIDIYNAETPVGVELAGKKQFEGLKLAYGPQLWWGANPSLFLKYRRQIGRIDATLLLQEEFAEQTTVTTTQAIPMPATRRATLHAKTGLGPFGVELGGIWAGSTKEGEVFQVAEEIDGGYDILADTVRASDAWGGKVKLTMERGRFHWYAQAAYMGLVADGGPTSAITYTGWNLKDSGWYNQYNVMTGLAVDIGKFQFAPNILWQKPIVGPMPNSPRPGVAEKRNVRKDPFAVRDQREMTGVELVITRDPTPATWMWVWDNDLREDARLAWSLGVVFRDVPTTLDAAIAFTEDGKPFAFSESTPPRVDPLWEVKLRMVSRLRSGRRVVAHVYFGTGEANGEDQRLIERFGGDVRIAWDTWAFETFAKFDDWGVYDYHRDFNLTFPVHLMADLSHTLGTPRWFGFPQTKVGVRGTWRSLDQFSNRYVPNISGDDGTEWEIRTYMHLSL
jgi:hypothetical protein